MAARDPQPTLVDVDALLDAVLAQPETEQLAALERACGEQPGHAEALRRRYASLASLGLLDAQPEAEQLPRRLGDFILLERLGGGGMGVVYRARQEPIGRLVALKLLRPELTLFGDAKPRLRREAEAVARLDHHGIVPLYTFGEVRGLAYLAMQLVDGCSLAELLRHVWGQQPERLTCDDLVRALRDEAHIAAAPDWCRDSWPRAMVRLCLQVAQALAHAHERGVVHRDVKPGNVMLARDGRVVLLDFGLALAEGSASLTRTGTAMGSFGYASPEQVEGRAVDARTDVFSLGAVLYELLALHAPFVGENARASIQLVVSAEPTSLQRRAGVDPGLAAVVARALAKDPRQRYLTMAAFAGDLRAWLDDLPLSVRPDTALSRALRFVRREPLRAGFYAALATAVLAIAAGGGYVLANRSVLRAGRDKLAADAAERALALGLLEVRGGRRDAAAAAFSRALTARPDDPEAAAALRALEAPLAAPDLPTADSTALFAAALGQLFGPRESLREPRQALRLVATAMGRTPHARLGYHVVWAQAAALAQDHAAAREAAQALALLWPSEPLAALAAGYALLDVDRPGALAAMRRGVTLAPNQPDAQAALGAALCGCGAFAEAEPLLRAVVAAQPDDTASRINLAIAREQLGDVDGALGELRTASARDPRHPGAQFNLGRVLLARGEREAGAAALRRTLELEPRYAQARRDLGLLATDAGNHAEALAHLGVLVDLRPHDAESWRVLGFAQASAGDAAGAIASHRRLLELAPDDADAHDYLCTLLAAQGDEAGVRAERARVAARAAEGKR